MQHDEIERRTRRRRRVRSLLAIWAVFVSVFLLWQTLTYRGLMALAAEWQFNTFGRYYPSLTYILLAAIIASPVLWLLRGRRRRDDEVRGVNYTMTEAAQVAAKLPGRNFIRAILGVAGGCVVACLVVLIAMASLPSDVGQVQRIAIGSPAAIEPRTGPTELVGSVLRSRTAGLNQELLVARRTIRFAPMLSPGGNNREALHFFVEIGADENAATLQSDGTREGVLRRHGLPGELVRLFQYAGYEVADPYYVLFASRSALQWPYRVAAIQLAIVGLICLIAAGGLHVRRERLRRHLREQDVAIAPAGTSPA
ncbi:hypothetical protein ASG67_02505 [Sphingomonas sp. Leaf339]|uniref:hypothetical protein n=1 Tax=Sphingomonas sp. Leaf339 TaxID=1736343 RepID=UPI0006F849D9|nr:hypothetical protein [Sphingomonas sp. Leaf339]KQU62031.1 hypothetical protein ASG67_02505 [Sphingomonas sp. Leaf339]